MPVTSGKNVGSQNIAKGGVNLYDKSGAIAANQTYVSGTLECPGLPKLTWIVSQTAGAGGATITPQVAIRRIDHDANVPGTPAPFDFQAIAPPAVLDPGGTPTVFEFNAPVQAIRLGVAAANVDALTQVTTIIAASG